MDLQTAKSQLRRFLELEGYELKGNKPLIHCPSPDHGDSHPSGVVYEDRVYCPVCNKSFDIFDIARGTNGFTDFIEAKKYVYKRLGIDWDFGRKDKPVGIDDNDAKKIFSDKNILDFYNRIRKSENDTQIGGKWFFRNESGLIELCEVRFEFENQKKQVLSFWTNGKSIKIKNYPILIYNREKLKGNIKPILIVEGAKSAEAANALGEYFLPLAWNGGGKKVSKIDWNQNPMNDSVYIYPDDDQVKAKSGNLLPWHKQPGFVAALEIKKQLPSAKIVKPLEAARKLKPSGADIVEALQVMSADELAEYIFDSDGIEPPAKKAPPKAEPVDKDSLPFRILGIHDFPKAAFLSDKDRIHIINLSNPTKNDFLLLAPQRWWLNHFPNTSGSFSKDDASEFLIVESMKRDFCPHNLRGRGAWRDHGIACYNDGETTYGSKSNGVIYQRKLKVEVGIGEQPASLEVRKHISKLVGKMSFETYADPIRLLGWIALAPFAGALPWRPSGLLTGESKSGKSTVYENVVRPLALPLAFSGGSTEAGLRQSLENDSLPIILEECEPDTPSKKKNLQNLFTLMRQSTTEGAPSIVKGTASQKPIEFSMRSMFLFIAISPVIEQVADDNRVFHVKMSSRNGAQNNDWEKLKIEIRDILTEKVCQSVRSFVWSRLDEIIHFCSRVTDVIEQSLDCDKRFATAQGMLLGAYMFVFQGQENATDEQIKEFVKYIFETDPPDETRLETDEDIDKILSHMVTSNLSLREKISLREALIAIKKGQWERGELCDELSQREITELRALVGRHGLGVTKNGNLVIAQNHIQIKKILDKGTGYHRELLRHPNLLEQHRVVKLAGKATRCLIFGNQLETDLPSDRAGY